MPLIINNIKTSVSDESITAINIALKSIGLSNNSNVKAKIYKTSLDARKQNDIHFVHSVYVDLSDEKKELNICKKYSFVNYISNSRFEPEISVEKKEGRVYIAGFGPAGMFCALVLSEYGYKPVILEKGGDIDSRVKSVTEYWNGGKLDVNSNVQFGEGGAGTFSDGKLTTRIKDPLCRYVLEQFVRFGAPSEIMTKAKPHIGTDKLRMIVKSIREYIISLGGEIRFNTSLTDMMVKNSTVEKIVCDKGEDKCSAVVLATGHSARDTFEMLAKKNIFIEPKPFSVGVRIEHKQSEVNKSLYGKHCENPLLPKGEYQLSYRNKEGRAVYTFCMCPGGVVVPSASEEKTIVTNGMSEFARDKDNANAAIVVSVTPNDFGNGVLDGMYFARETEQRAYKMTNGVNAPATTVKGFLEGRPDLDTDIKASYARGVQPCEMRKIFPEFVVSMLEEGFEKFSKKMKCFGNGKALMTGPETRTSSPVRITRNEKLNSISLENLFPCGEGAGYAGGIMSAAVDGIKVALEIMKRQAP